MWLVEVYRHTRDLSRDSLVQVQRTSQKQHLKLRQGSGPSASILLTISQQEWAFVKPIKPSLLTMDWSQAESVFSTILRWESIPTQWPSEFQSREVGPLLKLWILRCNASSTAYTPITVNTYHLKKLNAFRLKIWQIKYWLSTRLRKQSRCRIGMKSRTLADWPSSNNLHLHNQLRAQLTTKLEAPWAILDIKVHS